MLSIDGTYGEGGGQVLRTSLTLAAVTRRPVRIFRIRAKRKNPGLAPQHLTTVLALAAICDATVSGAFVGSTEIVFRPKSRPRSGRYVFDVTEAARRGSAGSVTLIFQTLLLPLAFSGEECRLVLKGGTHVPWSPPFDYIAEVFLPTVAPMGVRAECRLDAWGFYPRGGGRITMKIAPGADADKAGLRPLVLLKRGALQEVRGMATVCNLPAHIARRLANAAEEILAAHGPRVTIIQQTVEGPGPGAAFCLVAQYEKSVAGFSAIGQKGVPAELVAEQACREFLGYHDLGAPVDSHLADQLLLPMALASGESTYCTAGVTRHLLTNAHIIRRFIPVRIDIHGKEGEKGTVSVRGVGFAGAEK